MIAEVLYNDDKKVLGMVLQGENSKETDVLSRYHREGMMPVAFSGSEGLVVTFGRPVVQPAAGETDTEEEPIHPGKYAG